MAMIEHGGNLAKAIEIFGGHPSEWMDISTGISPFSAPLPQFDLDVWRRLPESRSVVELEALVQDFYGASLSCRAVAGSQFVINLLPKILTGKVGIVEPCYGEYANAFAKDGLEYVSLKTIEDCAGVTSVILANPNNPDGCICSSEALLQLAKVLGERGGYLVVDEAFADAEPNVSLLGQLETIDNIIVLRSFGKFFGLAGLRLGFVFASEKVLAKLDVYRGPWSVTGPAIAVAQSVLKTPNISQVLTKRIHHRCREMEQAFVEAKADIIGGTSLFFLIQHKDADSLHHHLQTKHILSRKFDYNTTWLRLGLTQNSDEDKRLSEALLSFEGK
jgi:cobalamin biosynthetic protein CobC